ncbi:TetR/AcrR family transcriptional regulator [Aquipseudomonas campi]
MAYRASSERLDRDQQLRERILDCALARVSDGGFSALTMQALAEDAGIATGSLYRHFSGKGELAAEVFSAACRIEIDVLAEVLRGPGTPVERLAAGLEQFAARAWHSRRLAFALIAEPVDAEVDEQRLLFREAYAELFSDLLNEGIGTGDFRIDQVGLAAACLVGAIAEALVGPLSPPARAAREAGHTQVDFATVNQTLITFCLRAVGAPES